MYLFYTRTTFIQKQTIQDIQPSTRPRINISQVPAGRFLFFLCFIFSVFLCFCLFVFYVFIYVFFDCKCNSLKRLGENINKTERNIKQQKTTQRKTATTEIQDIQPSTRPRINISQVLAGRFLLFLFFLYVVLRVCMFSFLNMFLYGCFSIVNAKASKD